jgi:hypothetical protein
MNKKIIFSTPSQETPVKLKILNAYGCLVKNAVINRHNDFSWDISNVPTELYLVSISGIRQTQKLLVKK